MSDNDGLNVGYGGGEVDGAEICWAADRTEGWITVDGVEPRGAVDGSKT